MAAEVGVVIVWIMWTFRVEILLVVVRSTFAVHSPEQTQDEHDHPQNHTAEGERLQAALGRVQEGCGASGHDEEGSDEDCSVVQGRHPRPGLELFLRFLRVLWLAGYCHSSASNPKQRAPHAL